MSVIKLQASVFAKKVLLGVSVQHVKKVTLDIHHQLLQNAKSVIAILLAQPIWLAISPANVFVAKDTLIGVAAQYR